MVVTGQTSSRLSELRKYKVTDEFHLKYRGGGSLNSDGVDFDESDPETIVVYYLGGIKYFDDKVNNITTYEFVAEGTGNTLNFINAPIYKNPSKLNIIGEPKIQDDVFISRQQLSVFDNIYKLEFVDNLSGLITYLGGNYFNIVNNT
jgi:hypothetical protein